MLTHIDLFSGIGGFTLAAEWAGFRTIVFCEKDEFCQKVLQRRFGAVIADSRYIRQTKPEKQTMGNKQYNKIPLIPDIRDFDGTKWREATLLTGGFPCQPFSVAGKQRGKEDDRYLWPEMFRVIKEAKPHWILAENVAGIIRMELDTVLSDLESEDYETGTVVIPACGLNAPHRRYRVWIIGYSKCDGWKYSRSINAETTERERTFESSNSDALDTRIKESRRISNFGWEKVAEVGKTNSNASDSLSITRWTEQKIKFGGKTRIEVGEHRRISQREWDENWFEVATRLCRVDDGIPNRVDRLKALGNAIVPQIAYEIIKRIAWIERNE